MGVFERCLVKFIYHFIIWWLYNSLEIAFKIARSLFTWPIVSYPMYLYIMKRDFMVNCITTITFCKVKLLILFYFSSFRLICSSIITNSILINVFFCANKIFMKYIKMHRSFSKHVFKFTTEHHRHKRSEWARERERRLCEAQNVILNDHDLP